MSRSQYKLISESIIQVNKNLIFLVPTGSQMEKAGKKLGMKIAAEIFSDRNYEDDGNLVSRSKENAMITDPAIAKKHVIKMVENQALNCYSGKQIPCDIRRTSYCVHSFSEFFIERAAQGILETRYLSEQTNGHLGQFFAASPGIFFAVDGSSTHASGCGGPKSARHRLGDCPPCARRRQRWEQQRWEQPAGQRLRP